MDKACLECWHSSEYKDSIIVQLDYFKVFAIDEITMLTTLNDELTLDNAQLEIKVVRNRRLAFASLVGLAGSIVLLFGIK